jgi:hypothetical protein
MGHVNEARIEKTGRAGNVSWKGFVPHSSSDTIFQGWPDGSRIKGEELTAYPPQ